MIDTEKVIKGLQGVFRCVSPVNHTCGDCPYQDNRVGCIRRVVNDAIALLKAQKPRLMTLEEVLALGDNDFVYIETRLVGSNTKVKPAIYQPDNSSDDEGDGYCCIVSSWGESGFYHRENYNQSWRCWISRPTDEQKEAEPWDR